MIRNLQIAISRDMCVMYQIPLGSAEGAIQRTMLFSRSLPAKDIACRLSLLPPRHGTAETGNLGLCSSVDKNEVAREKQHSIVQPTAASIIAKVSL
jgi:hypothetical protein